MNSCQYESMLKEYAEYLEAARIKLMPKELNCSDKEDLHQQLLSHQVTIALCLYLLISLYFGAKSCAFVCKISMAKLLECKFCLDAAIFAWRYSTRTNRSLVDLPIGICH